MFNLFRKKQEDKPTENVSLTPESGVSPFVIITAATNFGLVVMPDTKKPLMFAMEPTDTIATCVERNAPYVSAAVDINSCLVIQLSAELPNHTHAANKIFALVLPDPGVLINQDLVVVGYEEIDKVPGATNSMLKMLVKQVPKEYFAESMVEPGHKNNPSTTPVAAAAPVATDAPTEPVAPVASQPVEAAGFDPAPVSQPTETVAAPTVEPVATEEVQPGATPTEPIVEPLGVTPAPENTGQTS